MSGSAATLADVARAAGVHPSTVSRVLSRPQLIGEPTRHAVHAAMAGKTGLVIGHLHDEFIHVPIEQIVATTKQVDPQSPLWSAVLSSTGQAARFE